MKKDRAKKKEDKKQKGVAGGGGGGRGGGGVGKKFKEARGGPDAMHNAGRGFRNVRISYGTAIAGDATGGGSTRGGSVCTCGSTEERVLRPRKEPEGLPDTAWMLAAPKV